MKMSRKKTPVVRALAAKVRSSGFNPWQCPIKNKNLWTNWPG